jgi:hypothetical protein
MNNREIRARRNLTLPIDPLKIQSMGEYDFTLLHSRTWFEYDSNRQPYPGIIETWKYDAINFFLHFRISQLAKWSNGNQITSSDLILNLNRSFKSGSSFGASILSLIDETNIVMTDDLNFSIKLQDGQSFDTFFERMGSVFLAVVHPIDLNADLSMKQNSISSGPFVVEKKSGEDLALSRNQYYLIHNENGPEKILFRSLNRDFNFRDFSSGKTWENYVQTNSFLPEEEAQELLKSNLPLWTRSHDRVSLLRVGNGLQSLKQRESLLIYLAQAIERKGDDDLPLGVRRAESLQPPGFPLFRHLGLPENLPERSPLSEIKILTVEGLSTEFHREKLKPLFLELSLKVVWDEHPLSKFVKLLTTDDAYGLALVSFGVADPEPSTWMSLVMDSEFIHVLPEEKMRFEKILRLHDREKEKDQLKGLLQTMFSRGSYLPLFWGSTLSVGQSEMSFERISKFDETVDLSKVVFRK